MTMTPKPKVLIFGTGSIGAVYLYQLQQAGCEVTAVCRSNYDAVVKNGFRLNSVRYGNVNYCPDHVIRDVAEVGGVDFDYVVICSKVFPAENDEESLSYRLRPVLEGNDSAAIVLAQNGIMIEEEFANRYPANPLLSGVIYCPAYQTSPGVVEYPEMMSLFELGTYPAQAPAHHKTAATAFAELMRKGGGGAEVHEDIQVARWSKLVMNAPWNPICALTLCTDGEFLTTSDPFAYELVWETMIEIVLLAQTVGVKGVTEEIAREKLDIAMKRARTGTGREMSMLQDVRLCRPLEIEAIIGNAVHAARERGLKLTRLETIYALVKARGTKITAATNGKQS